VADSLFRQPAKERVLYISEDSFDAPFTSLRAHSRNRVIHALGLAVFVAQSSEEKGGTWHGTMYNLRNCISPVAVFCDGSEVADRLIRHGAIPVSLGQLEDIPKLFSQAPNLFDR
jgi:predicted Rossmann fold nucleotide-binding protein DprA/Smf involved in DNA uptake